MAVAAVVERKDRYCKAWDNSDAVLLLDGQQFHVHKLILSMASPKFKELFSSKDLNVVEISDLSEAAVIGVLDIVYQTNNKLQVTAKFEEMLKFAKDYEMNSVRDVIDFTLCEYNYSNDLLYLADEFNLKRTLRHMIAYMVHNDQTNVAPIWGETLKSLPPLSNQNRQCFYTSTFFKFNADRVSNDTMFETLIARLVPIFIEKPATRLNTGEYQFTMSYNKYIAAQNIVTDCCKRFPNARAYFDKRFGSFGN